jgi:integrase
LAIRLPLRRQAETLAFGVYPKVSLAEARVQRDAARLQLEEGRDPAGRKRRAFLDALTRERETFGGLYDEWLERLVLQGRSEATLKKMRWLLDFAKSELGERRIADIHRARIASCPSPVRSAGSIRDGRPDARHVRHAVPLRDRHWPAQSDVAYDLRGTLITPTPTHMAALTDPKAVGGLLRAIEGYDGQPVVRHSLRLAALLFMRLGELRLSEWDEFNMLVGVWTIPVAKMKMRRSHKVPLSRQALGILEELDAISGEGKLLFPSVRSDERPISDKTLNAALRRLGYDKTQMTAHGFRATASTMLNEMGKWHPDAIERKLAHVESNDVRRAYARGEHWDERVRMIQEWSNYLDQLRADTTPVGRRFPIRMNDAAPSFRS